MFDSRRWQEKEVPMNTLVCLCGSFVELYLALAFRSLSGDNLALVSHPRTGQSHIFSRQTLASSLERFLRILFRHCTRMNLG